MNIIKSLKSYNNNNLTISSALNEYKFCIILARTNYGKGIIVYSGNLVYVQSMVDISDLEIIGITKYVEPYPKPIKPIGNLFIDELDTELFYSPKTSISPLIDILKKRFCNDDNIKTIIGSMTICGNVSVSEINYWMYRNGLYKYRFMNYRDSKITKDCEYTMIDEMVITYIGNHYIWVKNKAYNRPELDILPYNVENISLKNNWSKIFPYNRDLIKIIAISINAVITPTGPSIYMITTYPPGKTFINFDSNKLLSEFFKWLREDIMNNITTIILAGYFSSLFDFELLKASMSPHMGWSFIENDYMVSQDGLKIILMDFANFSFKLTLEEYCQYWNKNNAYNIKDLITKQEAKIKIKLLEKSSLKFISVLYDSIITQSVALNTLLSPWNVSLFNRIEDIIIVKSNYSAATHIGNSVYYPSGYDAFNFIQQSIQSKYVKTVGVSNPKSYSVYRLKSIVDIIGNESYPVGLPMYVKSFNEDKLYIALCKITIKNNIKIPIIFNDDINESSYTFYTPLTSIDIQLARKIGGYKIKEICGLQWEESVRVKKCIDDTIDNVGNIYTDKSDYVHNYLTQKTDLIAHNDIYHMNTLFAAFAVSYCRKKLHTLIENIDSHFLGDYVIKHNYRELWISNTLTLDTHFLCDTIKMN
ncbi:SPV024 putative EEV maturation protein [Swinepox virus]|uniref:SPV024 putative EEV maturation protein n=1 Tax=Swinepox virus (strain Swine/Nebraska/17077-99/1999) TaxID=300880 RepID=Q8V3R9_SWPV1|nr:EEV maturation protein [Swinepox virus]AAL69763.1 SPV024 putative EEV maturation protein [Swinepox virus]UUA44214.1 SPV024 [Swinepox virus]